MASKKISKTATKKDRKQQLAEKITELIGGCSSDELEDDPLELMTSDEYAKIVAQVQQSVANFRVVPQGKKLISKTLYRATDFNRLNNEDLYGKIEGKTNLLYIVKTTAGTVICGYHSIAADQSDDYGSQDNESFLCGLIAQNARKFIVSKAIPNQQHISRQGFGPTFGSGQQGYYCLYIGQEGALQTNLGGQTYLDGYDFELPAGNQYCLNGGGTYQIGAIEQVIVRQFQLVDCATAVSLPIIPPLAAEIKDDPLELMTNDEYAKIVAQVQQSVATFRVIPQGKNLISKTLYRATDFNRINNADLYGKIEGKTHLLYIVKTTAGTVICGYHSIAAKQALPQLQPGYFNYHQQQGSVDNESFLCGLKAQSANNFIVSKAIPGQQHIFRQGFGPAFGAWQHGYYCFWLGNEGALGTDLGGQTYLNGSCFETPAGHHQYCLNGGSNYLVGAIEQVIIRQFQLVDDPLVVLQTRIKQNSRLSPVEAVESLKNDEKSAQGLKDAVLREQQLEMDNVVKKYASRIATTEQLTKTATTALDTAQNVLASRLRAIEESRLGNSTTDDVMVLVAHIGVNVIQIVSKNVTGARLAACRNPKAVQELTGLDIESSIKIYLVAQSIVRGEGFPPFPDTDVAIFKGLALPVLEGLPVVEQIASKAGVLHVQAAEAYKTAMNQDTLNKEMQAAEMKRQHNISRQELERKHAPEVAKLAVDARKANEALLEIRKSIATKIETLKKKKLVGVQLYDVFILFAHINVKADTAGMTARGVDGDYLLACENEHDVQEATGIQSVGDMHRVFATVKSIVQGTGVPKIYVATNDGQDACGLADVLQWLEKIGQGALQPLFKQHKIGVDVLLGMDSVILFAMLKLSPLIKKAMSPPLQKFRAEHEPQAVLLSLSS